MEIVVKVEAPVLADAINALAAAIAGNIELLLDGARSQGAVTSSGEPDQLVEIKTEAATSGETPPTIEQVRALFVAKNSVGNRDKLKQILSDFNVKKVTDLQEKDFAAVIARLEEL